MYTRRFITHSSEQVQSNKINTKLIDISETNLNFQVVLCSSADAEKLSASPMLSSVTPHCVTEWVFPCPLFCKDLLLQKQIVPQSR
jgi:hypothetical protein